MPPTENANDALKTLLEENLTVAKDNNRLLRDMRRFAFIGFGVKVAIWLIVLGVPLFLLGAYIGPLMEALTGQGESEQALPAALLGIPSEDQLNALIEQYQSRNQ